MKNNNKTSAEKAVNNVVLNKKSNKKLVKQDPAPALKSKPEFRYRPKNKPTIQVTQSFKIEESFGDKVKRVLKNIFGF